MMARRLLWWEPFWVLALAPLILLPGRVLPPAWQPLAVLLLFLFWPIRWLAERRLLPPAPLNLALSLLLLWLPVNIWASPTAEVAWQAAGYLLLGVAFYAATAGWPPFIARPPQLAWLLVALGAALALLGPLVAIRDQPWQLIDPLQQAAAPLVDRLGETINPNILAGALVVLLPLTVALALPLPKPSGAPGGMPGRRWPAQIALLALAALMLGVILLADSRGAVLAAGAALLLVLCLRWPRLLWGVLLAGGLAAFWLWWRGDMGLLERLGSGGAIGGLDERLEIWSRARYAIQDFSFTGVGLGAYNQVIPLLYPYFLIAPSVDIPHAHNLVLQVAIDLGIPGLIAWLAILMAVVIQAIALLRRGPSPLWALGAGVLGGLAAMLVHGMLDATLWGTKLAFLPWLLYALPMLAEAHQRSRPPFGSPPPPA
ncbi:MAG: O-antigen ligase family protein [Caldilinea sp.]|nr:O-antigen ligase family protein [Caldilinea sp.]